MEGENREELTINSGPAPTIHSSASNARRAGGSRKAVLDSYAAVLSARDEALDAKAATLLEVEAEVQAHAAENEKEQNRLVAKERKLRLEMASFMDDLASKQAFLVEIEV